MVRCGAAGEFQHVEDEARAMRRTASDAHTIAENMKSEVGDEEKLFATNMHYVAKRISERGRAEDVSTAICVQH